jgi:hypothetical protein
MPFTAAAAASGAAVTAAEKATRRVIVKKKHIQPLALALIGSRRLFILDDNSGKGPTGHAGRCC